MFVYVYIYSVQLNISNINTKIIIALEKSPQKCFSSCCETEMVDLLLGLHSLNIAQKMFLTHLSLFLVVKCTLSKSTLEKGVSVLSTCSPISCEVNGKAALKNVSHQICQAETTRQRQGRWRCKCNSG